MGIGYEIVRLRLVNFAHFTTILGVPDLEIDRRGSKNNIILVSGSNGSGKSLLMSHWTPRVNDSTNNRKRPLIEPGCEGIKEVDIITTDDDSNHGEYLYKCKIIYGESSTNCSLIREDRVTGECVELNESGLVTSYERIITELFGINKNYSNIGYLSPQVTSLVSMTPSVRYNYISSWLPDIDNYMEAYRLVFKKINSINRQIKMLETDIGDISVEEVTQKTGIIKDKIKTIEKNISDLNRSKMRLDIVKDNLANVDRNFIKNKISILNKNLNILNSNHDKLIKLNKKSKKYIGKDGLKKLEKDIIDYESKMKSLKDRLEWVSNSINEKRIQLKETEYNLGVLEDTGDSLPEVSSMIERVEKSIYESKKIIEKYQKSYKYLSDLSDSFSMNEFNILSNIVTNINDKLKRITGLISLDKLNNVSEYSNLIDKESTLFNNKIKDIEEDISKNLERITLLKNTPLDPDILDRIPDDCNISCGVIEEIKRLLSPDIEIERIQNNVNKLYKNKGEILKSIEDNETDKNDMKIAINYIADIDHILYRDKNYIAYLPEKIRSMFCEDVFKIYSNMNSILQSIEIIREYTSLVDQYKTYSKEVKSLKEKETSLKFIRNINSEIKNLSVSIDKLIDERKKLTEDGSNLLEEYHSLNELKDSLHSINESVESYNNDVKIYIDDKDKIKKLCKDWYYREIFTKALVNIDIEIKNFEIELMSCKDEYEKLNNSLVTKKSLIEMRDRLIKSTKDLEILQEAWNPKTGIPSLFINNFLTRIHARSNVYLEALNGKDLKILKFEIGKTAREFPIIIDKNGTTIPDASQCSEGQIALLTLAISLAMIHEAVSENGYNIIRLDELDACLDYKRKKLYIEMIQERLREINSKQCLIISHSNEFDNIKCDIILLPGSNKSVDSLNNKNILLNLTDVEIDNFNE